MIEEYIEESKANGKAQKTIESYIYVLNRLNNFKSLEQITKKDLIEFFSKFEGTLQSKRLFQGIIKKFYVQNGKKEIVDWIQLVKINIIDSDENTLKIEDINKLIENTTSPYWKAYISVLFETGARFSELQACTWNDFSNNTLKITTTKTGIGIRKIPLLMSGVYLDDLQVSVQALPNENIFHYSEEWTLQTLSSIAKASGITKPINPHRFRHARATDLVRRGTQESIIRKILGWTPTSTMIARYQHMNDNSISEAMIGATLKKEEIPEMISGESKLQNLMVENHELKEDVDQLKREIEDMKNFQIQFFKSLKQK